MWWRRCPNTNFTGGGFHSRLKMPWHGRQGIVRTVHAALGRGLFVLLNGHDGSWSCLPFVVAAPEVDETPLAEETPRDLALRLAVAKARAVARQHPQAVVIGSDQVADLGGHPLGKPGTHERATAQLRQMRGQTVIFQTAVAVVCEATGFEQVDLAPVEVRFRDTVRR
jgi:hypothetical protein